MIIAGPTNTSITLSWATPIEDGGRPEDVVTYGFHARPVGEVDIVTLGYVNETSGTAKGLFPFTDYDVFVSSENGVSSLDPDIPGRSASVRTTTQIGGEVVLIVFVCHCRLMCCHHFRLGLQYLYVSACISVGTQVSVHKCRYTSVGIQVSIHKCQYTSVEPWL